MPLSRRLSIAILAAAIAAGPAFGETRGCGTVVVPTGVGLSDQPQPVTTLHPALYTGSVYETQLMNLLYRPLVWVGAGMRIDWAAGLASAIDANADDTVFTVTLKPYAWSDGRPVTADDVVYDWTLIKALGETYSQYGNGGVPALIRAIRALDAHHVEFDVTRPVNPQWFELAGISQFYALPRHAWGRDDIAAQQTLQSEASFYRVVDGPFHLQELSLGRHAVFVPNPHYGGHQATIRRLVVNFLQGTDPLEALETGQIDMATLPFQLTKAASAMHDVRRIALGPAPEFGSITPNERNPADPFFDQVPVRQAIARAIDQKRIIDAVFDGSGALQTGLVPSAMRDLLAPDLRDGHSPLSYDPAAARALLDQAGWVPGPDGIRTRNGRRLAFSVLVTAGAETRLMLLQLIQADLARVGIAMAIKEVEFNQLIARMLGPPADWDAVFLDYTIETFPDPMQFLATGASGNYEHYSNPVMDRLLAQANRAPKIDGFYAVEDYAVLQQPMIFLPDGAYTVLARPGIEEIDKFISTNGYWSPEYLTLHGAMACDAAHA